MVVTALPPSRATDDADALRLEQALVEADLSESLAGALADSDTATELLHDHADDERHLGARPLGRRRLLLGLLGLLAVAMSGARVAKRRR